MIGEMLAGLTGGGGWASLVKVAGGVLTVLLVVPAVIKLFMVTIDEGWAAIRTRNGKPIIRRPQRVRGAAGPMGEGEVLVIRPGTHVAFPLFYWYKLVDVRVRAKDLPARHMTTARGTQFMIHASFEWRPIVNGRDLRVYELAVENVAERVQNIVGAALRDVIRGCHEMPLPSNDVISDLVLDACRVEVRELCGVELLRVTLTGDALTEGALLADAIRSRGGDDVAAEQAALAALLR